MRLSIQTLMSGMEHRQGAEKRWSFNKHFYEYLPPPEMLRFFSKPFYESSLFMEQKENGALRAVVQISGDRLGHTVTVSDSPTLYVCRGKSPREVCAKPTLLSRDLSSMIEKIAFPTLCACPGESSRCAWDGELDPGGGLAGRFSTTSSSRRQCWWWGRIWFISHCDLYL